MRKEESENDKKELTEPAGLSLTQGSKQSVAPVKDDSMQVSTRKNGLGILSRSQPGDSMRNKMSVYLGMEKPLKEPLFRANKQKEWLW